MLKIQGIEKEIKYQNSLIISNIHFIKGKIYSILGHNGSGKSTLLKIIYNIEKYEKGKILIENKLVNNEIIHNHIAYCPQRACFLRGTLRDNFNYLYSYSESKDLLSKDEMYKLLDEFNLTHKLDTNVSRLSGGEQAKAQFIRTLLMNKDIYLFDESMANMDFKTIKQVEENIIKLKNNNKCVILVTHDFIQARRLSDYIVFMENLNYIDTFEKDDFFSEYVF